MIDLCELGERPPLGEVPTRMHAYLVRQNRFGQPRDAWRREIIPTPTLGPDEVLIYVMASGINYNNVWAALGTPLDVIAERQRAGEPEDFHAGGSDCSGHRVGPRARREERQGRRRGGRAQRLVAARRSVGALGQGPDARGEHAHLGLPDQLRELLPVRALPGSPVRAQAEAAHLGRGGLLPALRLDRLPDAHGLAASRHRARRRRPRVGSRRRARQHGARDHARRRRRARWRSSPTTPSASSARSTAPRRSSTGASSPTGERCPAPRTRRRTASGRRARARSARRSGTVWASA